MLGQRRRRWANIKTTLVKRMVLQGMDVLGNSIPTWQAEPMVNRDKHLNQEICGAGRSAQLAVVVVEERSYGRQAV